MRLEPVFAPEVPPKVRFMLAVASTEALRARSRGFRAPSILVTVLAPVTLLAWISVISTSASVLTRLTFALLLPIPGTAVLAAIGYRAWKNRMLVRRHRSNMIRPDVDLAESARILMSSTAEAMARVVGSRAAREGRLPGCQELMEEQQWRIAKALAALTRARAMLGDNAAVLPEQAKTARAAAEGIERRVDDVLRYATSVEQVDRSLGTLDTATQRESIDEHLRDALAVTSDGSYSSALADNVRQEQAGLQAALRAVRDIGDTLHQD